MPILHEKISAIILAAGVGKRMKSRTPKILHRVLGKPIVSFVTDLAREIGSSQIILVVNDRADDLSSTLGEDLTYVIQEEPLGSGDAAKKGLTNAKYEHALILCGDVPLLRKQTILSLIEYHTQQNAEATVLTCNLNNPSGYGRIIRNHHDYILQIIEECDATPEQQEVNEINAGVYYAKKELLSRALERITPDNKQGEYYLTDAIRDIASAGKKVAGYLIDDECQIIGVNTQAQLARVRALAKDAYYERLMQQGVFIEDPVTTDIDLSVKFGNGVHIRPHTMIEGKTTINDGETIGPFVWIRNGEKIDTSDA